MAVVISRALRDPRGNPVPRARVAFASAPTSVPDVAVLTNSGDTFSLAPPAPGDYVIECIARRFAPASVSVLVSGKQPVRADMQLASR
jgi:hypothetical protein